MTKPKCVHHWMLEADGGNIVPAKCQKCGAKKKFSGFISYGADAARKINTMNAKEAKALRVGIHLPGSAPLRENEQAW